MRTFLLYLAVAAVAVAASEQGSLDRLPSHLKLVPGYERFRGGDISGRATLPDFAPVPSGAPVPDFTCAHITVLPVPANIDPKMAVRIPGPADRMPVLKPIPACPQRRQ
jgi:hypothetical protein